MINILVLRKLVRSAMLLLFYSKASKIDIFYSTYLDLHHIRNMVIYLFMRDSSHFVPACCFLSLWGQYAPVNRVLISTLAFLYSISDQDRMERDYKIRECLTAILIGVCSMNLWLVWKVFFFYYFVFLLLLSRKWIPPRIDHDSVALVTSFTTPIFDFHKVISATTISNSTPSLVKTSLKKN